MINIKYNKLWKVQFIRKIVKFLKPKWVLVETENHITSIKIFYLALLFLNRYILTYYKGSYIIFDKNVRRIYNLPCVYDNRIKTQIAEYIYVSMTDELIKDIKVIDNAKRN